MSNAGPLTTTFTAPSSCATATGLYQIWSSSGSSYHYEQGPLASMTACFPSGYDAGAQQQYYSPGLCPSGYTAACSSTEVVSATETETAYTCCPTAVDYTCAASSASGRPYLGCTTVFGDVIALAGVTAVSDGSSFPTSTTESAGNGIGANSIAVRFRSGDFSTTDGPGPVATATSSAPRWTTSCPTDASSTPSSAPAASGLSTPGIAGIGAGSAAGALLLAGFFSFFLCTRRRKQKALKSQLRPPPPPIPRNDHASRPVSHPPPRPPPKDMRAWLASPSPTPSDPKDNHLFGALKQPSPPRGVAKLPLDGAGCGPYELPSCYADEKPAERPYELYGGDLWGSHGKDHHHDNEKKHHHHQQQPQQQLRNLVSPPPPSFKSSSDYSTTTTSSSTLLLAKSRPPRDDPLRSNPSSPRAPAQPHHRDGTSGVSFWSPPPTYGAQPAELGYDSSPGRVEMATAPAPAATGGGGGWGRRWRTSWGMSWAPAELEATSAGEGSRLG